MEIYNSKKWRLVHDGTSVITLINGTLGSVTYTQQFVVECDTEQEALDAIATLGLKQGGEE